ncbi:MULTISPECIES: hypothetical protein [unclassified Lactococcus]|uniref:hypothetical protein n=1 Tax=unclassified Lactococcus TaxID=2643510 RepID=UPI0011CB3AEE|nr:MULTISPECIES: hypothetical protein [unclassified Lactococcus]MQW23336.1 hypothetical protein [Lactococcus sp. dk101]TXK37962.1 hypothetical protein FVP42_07190 [Lactococcus sp. dk310]TXK49616.1 hypothetical protein FVP43_07160 [Lactococcus sp. dk322]
MMNEKFVIISDEKLSEIKGGWYYNGCAGATNDTEYTSPSHGGYDLGNFFIDAFRGWCAGFSKADRVTNGY